MYMRIIDKFHKKINLLVSFYKKLTFLNHPPLPREYSGII